MKKLLLLFLTMTGMVSTASADWNDNVYLICDENDNWNAESYANDFKFTKLSTNNFRATVPGSYVTSGNWRFRFRVQGNEWWNVGPNTKSDFDVVANDYNSYQKGYNGIEEAFLVPENKDALYIHIFVTWNTSINQWNVRAEVTESTSTYNIAFTNPSVWSDENVKAHVFVDRIRLSSYAWPGDVMTNDNGVYKYSVDVPPYSRVIFSNNGADETSEFELENDAVYDGSGKIGTQTVSVNSYGMATFCSQYPLDFSTATPSGLKAYRITASNKTTGELTKAEVTKVPAGVGVYIEGDPSQDYTVSPTATANSIGENMLVGTVSGITGLTQTSGEYTNYILTVNKADGTTASEPKFFKVNIGGNNVPKEKAYLQIRTADAAREFFWFEGATSIESVKQNQTMNGEVYNLAGQRVAQPTNGLYIVNGKKVIMK